MNVFFAKIKDGQIQFSNKKEIDDFLKTINKKDVWVRIQRMTGERTEDQNRALHKYFELVAKELNEGGYTVQLVLQKKVDLSWDKEKVKELLWRPAQQAITGKKSTTKLDKVSDITEIYEHLTRHLGEKFGINVPFPHDPNKPKNYPQ